MTDRHFDQLGLVRMGDRFALRAFCALKKDDNFDDKVGRLKEALNGRGKRQGDQSVAVGVTGKSKRSLKPTLKVEFGWKHFSSGKYMQVKNSKGGVTRSVDMNRNAHYDVCLQKAQELFFPKQTNQFGKLTDMTDCHVANYNGEKITNERFTVASYKQETGMSLPRLYFVTNKAKRGKCSTYLLGKMTGKGKESVLQLCKLVNTFIKKTYTFLSVEEIYKLQVMNM